MLHSDNSASIKLYNYIMTYLSEQVSITSRFNNKFSLNLPYVEHDSQNFNVNYISKSVRKSVSDTYCKVNGLAVQYLIESFSEFAECNDKYTDLIFKPTRQIVEIKSYSISDNSTDNLENTLKACGRCKKSNKYASNNIGLLCARTKSWHDDQIQLKKYPFKNSTNPDDIEFIVVAGLEFKSKKIAFLNENASKVLNLSYSNLYSRLAQVWET